MKATARQLEQMRQWRLQHREHDLARKRADRAANRERYIENCNRWFAAHPGYKDAYNKAYYKRNKEKVDKANAEWMRLNPARKALMSSRRRERQKATNFISGNEANVIAQLVSSAIRLKCGICGKNMPKSDRTIDHVIPLAKGGTGDVWNLRIVHFACNARKNAKMPDELNFARDGAKPKNKTTRSMDAVATMQVEPEMPKTNAT